MINNSIFTNKQKLIEFLKGKKGFLKPKSIVEESLVIDDLFDTLFKDKNFNKLHLYKEALDCIVISLILCGKEEIPLIKPKSSFYKNYKWANQTVLDNILEVLTENGYCHHWKGYYNIKNPSASQTAKYYPTEKLMNKNLHTKHKRPDSYIQLYKKKGKIRVRKEYPETWSTLKKKENIKNINNLLETATVKFKYNITNSNYLYKPSFENQLEFLLNSNHLLFNPDQVPINTKNIFIDTLYGTRLYIDNTYEFEINRDSMYVYRSYCRGKLSCGGRFYTPVFQGIPSKWRHTVTINGESTSELDYSAHHIRLLYHQDGLDFTGEPYLYAKSDTENEDKRNVQKYIAMIAINAAGPKQSINAVRGAIEDDFDNDKYKSEIPDLKTIEEYYNDFLEYHKPIADYVSKDMGIKLQRKDSDIMESILVELTNRNIIGLPIHDSIIVQEKYRNTLEDLMTEEYYNITKQKPTISNK